jgi:signal transduction histidine kinase
MLFKINNLYQLTANKKRINLSIECVEPIKLYADENMTYVTLRNLVSNALKFTPEGKAIHLTVTKNHEFAYISVKDQGIGMNTVYVDKLLNEEHLQLKLGTSNEKGTGLGILLCKNFIQINNGKLQIHSTEGKGSEFIVSLPLSNN